MFSSFQTVLENNDYKSPLQIFNENNLVNSIDNMNHKILFDLSNTVVNAHKKFLEYQKNLFKFISKTFNDPTEKQYEILINKYKIYGDDIYESLLQSNDEVIKYILKNNTDIQSQVKLIQRFIDKHKHPDIEYGQYYIENIRVSYCIPPEKEYFITTVLNSNQHNNAWFLDEKRIEERMEKDSKLYTKEGMYLAVDIIKFYNEYMSEIKKLHKKYKLRLQEIKKAVESYMEEYKDNIKTKLEKTQNKQEKEDIIKELDFKSNKILEITNILTIHYRIYFRYLLSSFKKFAVSIQQIYSDLMERYA